MTAEEKFNNELLYVLKKLKEKALYTRKDKYIEYWVSFVEDNTEIPAKKENLILDKLEELGAIKIWAKDASPSEIMIEAYVFRIEVKQPKFDEFYDKLSEPLRKKEEYSKKSVEAIKKFLYIAECLKGEWDLTPKENSMQNGGVYSYFKKADQATIPPNRYFEWMRGCGLDDCYQLEGILTTLQQEGLILKARFINEAM